MNRCAIYVRISSDVLGEGLGVARQEKACRDLAKARGWTVAHVYIDNDISAFSGKRRPEYAAMLAAVAAGDLDRIIAWHGDRLHRSPTELESFINLIEATGCSVDTVQSGKIDLSTATGRLNARVVGSFARYESEQKSDRVKAKLEQNALSGKSHGGSRPYGWDDDRMTLREDEAAVVRYAAERIIAGASIKSIIRDLAEMGAVNTLGGAWRDVTIRSMLLRERNAAHRIHQGVVIGAGAWQPILTEEQMDSVRRILTNPDRRTAPGALGRTRLLSRIATCGVCGGPMQAAQGKPYKGVRKMIYRCDVGGCVTRDMEKLDAYVTRTVLRRLAEPDAADLLAGPTGDPHADARREADRLRQKLVDAAEDYAADVITREQMAATTAKLRPQLATLDALATPPAAPVGALAELVTSDDVRTTWDALDVRQQREVVALLVSVEVMPTRRGPGFRTDDVHVAPAARN